MSTLPITSRTLERITLPFGGKQELSSILPRREDSHSIEKTKKQTPKIDIAKEGAPTYLSSSMPLVTGGALTKKRKIEARAEKNQVPQRVFRDHRHDPCTDKRTKLRDYSRFSSGENLQDAPDGFFKSFNGDLGIKPSHPGDDMQKVEKPTHVFTVQNRKEAPYLEFIRQGTKKAECRVNTHAFRKIKVGDTIQFHNRHEGILCKVTYLHVYKTFREMVIGEGVKNILPHIYDDQLDAGKLIDRAVKVYENFPMSYRVREFGSIAIGVSYLRDYFKGR